MVNLSYDLHIHSCLSPCGDDDMLPSNIVGMAALKELDVIAVTDHNSCRNCPAVLKLAEEYGLTAIPGMELTTSEEVHVLCLFPELNNAMEFDSYVYDRLPDIQNNEDIFGKQQICDENDQITGSISKLLINATKIDFENVYEITKKFSGIMIPAHIEKSTNSLLANLGFIMPDSKFKCVEIKHIGYYDELIQKHNYLKNCNIITDSDAHYLEHINEPVHFIKSENKTARAVLNSLINKE